MSLASWVFSARFLKFRGLAKVYVDKLNQVTLSWVGGKEPYFLHGRDHGETFFLNYKTVAKARHAFLRQARITLATYWKTHA